MKTRYTAEEWRAEGERLFGPDQMDWKFVCPSCKHVASVRDWEKVGAPENTVAFSCIGRWMKADDKNIFQGKGGPCHYTGGGLFRLNPVLVTESGNECDVFAFAEAEEKPRVRAGRGGCK